MSKGGKNNSCPSCETGFVKSKSVVQEFPYGKYEITLKARVRLYTCQSCSFAFTKFPAEGSREIAVFNFKQGLLIQELQNEINSTGDPTITLKAVEIAQRLVLRGTDHKPYKEEAKP